MFGSSQDVCVTQLPGCCHKNLFNFLQISLFFALVTQFFFCQKITTTFLVFTKRQCQTQLSTIKQDIVNRQVIPHKLLEIFVAGTTIATRTSIATCHNVLLAPCHEGSSHNAISHCTLSHILQHAMK